MAIDSKQLKLEINKHKEIKKWIGDEVKNIKINNEELGKKVAILKKASRGSYSEELETAQTLLKITDKNLENYNEAVHQPYFARVDFREYRKEKESFYIGKFGLGDSNTGDEVVIDWRTPLADLYYSGTEGESYYTAPVGVINGDLSLKRKFLFRDGELKEAFDEGINEIIIKSGVGDENTLIDEFLRINLEESISAKLKDVVATIQKEQNEIIRAGKNNPIIVQGSAGSGKTTVALHRLAYLLYRYKERVSSEDILVIAPNMLFLDYISDVLPNLGIDKVKQKTFEQFAAEILNYKGKIFTKDKKLTFLLEEADEQQTKYITKSSKIRGSLFLKTVMDRYIKMIEEIDGKVESIKVDDYVLFDEKEIKRLFSKDLIKLPINKRKDEIRRYLSLKFNEKLSAIMERVDFSYEYYIARTKKKLEEGPERRKMLTEYYNERDEKKKYLKQKSKAEFEGYFDRWKEIDTKGLYYKFFNDEIVFDEITEGKIPKALTNYIKNEFEINEQNKVIDSDDLAAMLYLKLKIEGIDEVMKFKHIVIDEAQDYSLFQLAVLKELASNESLTIVGDIGQGIYNYKGLDDWGSLMEKVFDGEVRYMPLTQSYRSTVEIIELANRVLKKQDNNLKPAIPVLRHGPKPEISEFKTNKDFACELDKIVDKVHESGKKSIAVVGRTFKECKKIKEYLKKYSQKEWNLIKDNDSKIDFTNIIIPSYMTKGLEFDCLVVYNCDKNNYSLSEMDKKLLYVVLTRALHMEYIFYTGEKSELLD